MSDPPPTEGEPAATPPRGADSGRWLTAAAFVLVMGLLAGGFLLFPRLQRAITFQDCVATGRTDCVATGFTPR